MATAATEYPPPAPLDTVGAVKAIRAYTEVHEILDHNINPKPAKVSASVIAQITEPQELSPADRIISSPYVDAEHLLDLSTLDTPSRLFAQALTTLHPITDAYATTDYPSAFNWDEVILTLKDLCASEGFEWKSHSFYTVIFRSVLKESVDRELLGQLDKKSHEEATVSGGLLKYWFGSPNAERRNLATCLWRSRADAHNGGTGPWHRRARLAAPAIYQQIRFTTHRFTITDGAESWRFEDWQE